MSQEEFRPGIAQSPVDSGPFIAKVVSNVDPTYMGGLQVQIAREVGGDADAEGQLRTVKYLNPFYGTMNSDYITQSPETYDNTQKSHGMWFVPPEPGTLVVVIFIAGDPRKGYWLGCIQEENMNFMIPGYAATKYKISGLDERVPVAEYNKVARVTSQDPTQIPKPEHPFSQTLKNQGLLKDDIRGITTSSARRETPSQVFGISTPGPVDKKGKKFKGWINCKTGGPCGREDTSKGSYPACRPTKTQCKNIKGKMYKKKSSKRVNWEKDKEN